MNDQPPDEPERAFVPKPPLLNHRTPDQRRIDDALGQEGQWEPPIPMLPQTPMEMLGRAIQMGQKPEILERLLSLQERWERNVARKAYDEAMAAAAAELPQIVKDRTVSHGMGKTSYRHESLAAIERAVRPVLSKHGLHYRWRTGRDGADVVVTCIISGHGHHEENTLAGPADASGAKNAIQAIGSTTTYLQRYTLRSALGIAASDDDDGAGGSGCITAAQAAEILAEIKRLDRTEVGFCEWQKIDSIALLPAARFDAALRFLKGLKGKADETADR